MRIFFLVNSWEKKVQRVHLKDPGRFQNLSLWVCGCECLSGIPCVDVGVYIPCITGVR